MPTKEIIIACIFLGFALIETLRGGLFNKATEVEDDKRVESLSFLLILVLVQPGIFIFVGASLRLLLPEYENIATATPIVIQVILFLVFDDMIQYWWHRLAHTFVPIYNLHRAHHNAKYMSIRIVYRNNMLYYALMPNLWLSAVMVYIGFGQVYAFYLVIKMTVIFGAHSDWKWDQYLYRQKWLEPITWVVERLISTPSTHSAHHGLDVEDGITTYKGNFGNLLFFWDILFGTAKITRKYPETYGVKGMRKADWKEQLFWPFYKTPHPSRMFKGTTAKK